MALKFGSRVQDLELKVLCLVCRVQHLGFRT